MNGICSRCSLYDRSSARILWQHQFLYLSTNGIVSASNSTSLAHCHSLHTEYSFAIPLKISRSFKLICWASKLVWNVTQASLIKSTGVISTSRQIYYHSYLFPLDRSHYPPLMLARSKLEVPNPLPGARSQLAVSDWDRH
jgi:hypothetical protein